MFSLGQARCSHQKGTYIYIKLAAYEPWFYIPIKSIHSDSEIRAEGNEGELIVIDKQFGQTVIKQLEEYDD